MGPDEPTEVAQPTVIRAHAASALSESVHYVAEVDRDGVILAFSGPVASYSAADIVGTNVRRWIVPDALPAIEAALSEAFSTSEPRTVQWRSLERGHHYESRITPLCTVDGAARAVLTTVDVTERKREQEQLQEGEQLLTALVQGAFEGLQISVDAKILVANAALGRMVGGRPEDLVGKNGFDFCAPESLPHALAHFRAGRETPYEVIAVRLDGSRFPCEVLGRSITFRGQRARLTAFRDLTERRRIEREQRELQERMGQAQKLESLGTLAGGIAHDFNNVLMAVLANAEIALRAAETSGVSAKYLGDIRTAALRGRELTRQLLNYAAQGPLTTQLVDLNELVRDTIALLGVSISKRAQLSLQLSAEPAVVEGDPGQLRQLIMNLVINASEALAEQEGRIEVRIAPVHVAPGELAGSPLTNDTLSGRAILLRVSDTGHGMDEATQRRVFEPFFTTKVTGRGLGLASVLNIVRGHRGALRVQSELGRGTQFSVWLEQSHGAPSERPAPGPASLATKSRGLVLVVDDEPMLRGLACEALAELGFETLVAEDGLRALQLVAQHRARLVLVMLDLTMPKLNGVDALRRIRAQGARIPVLCTSGYSAELLGAEITSDPDSRFLPKPYSLSELTAGIDALLGSKLRS